MPYVKTLLVRYGEIGLKSPGVRRRFESILSENILRAHSNENISCFIDRIPGRFFVHSENPELTSALLSRSFGIVSISIVDETGSELEEISSKAVELAHQWIPSKGSFAIRARRTGSHSYTSMELASHVGERIMNELSRNSVSVSLSSPDTEIFIEVRNNRSYLFSEIIPGPGGLPVRSQGRVLSLIEDENSILASWLMMRRGCNVIPLKKSDIDSNLIEKLKPWNPWWSGFIELNDANLKDQIRLNHCIGLVLGWTMDNFERNEKLRLDIPVFYPLIGMTQKEIKEYFRNIFST